MQETYLILGSNIQPRRAYLEKAKYLLAEKAGAVLKESAVYSTEPWGVESDTYFLNQVILFSTPLQPESLLKTIHEIEDILGRSRNTKYGPRTIDIDILLWGDLVKRTTDLQIPHPFMQDRKFVLKPLCEIAPDVIHPVLGKSISTLAGACTDQKEVFILAAHEPADSI